MPIPHDDAQLLPSGSTAVPAGVLALAGAAYWAFETWAGVISVLHRSDPSTIVPRGNGRIDVFQSGVWIGWTMLAEVVLATGLLLAGGVLLLMRKSVGRWVILIGCGAVVAALFHPLFAGDDYYYRSFTSYSFLYLVPALVTAVLVIASPTRRWCIPRAT